MSQFSLLDALFSAPLVAAVRPAITRPPVDPDRAVLLSAGMQVRTERGTILTVPALRGTTKTQVATMHRWVLESARDEAYAFDDTFAGDILARTLESESWSVADMDSANDILFGDEKGALQRHIIG